MTDCAPASELDPVLAATSPPGDAAEGGISELLSLPFMPHGHCYLWDPVVMWLHVISDAVIACSYFSIPIALVVFIRRRRDLPANWMFWMFAAFILLCGTGHVFDVITVWNPLYWTEGVVDALTALASVLTAYALWPLIPHLLRMPSRGEMVRKNEELAHLTETLEDRIDQRTRDLSERNRELETLMSSMNEREGVVVALKEEVNALAAELGRDPPYDFRSPEPELGSR